MGYNIDTAIYTKLTLLVESPNNPVKATFGKIVAEDNRKSKTPIILYKTADTGRGNDAIYNGLLTLIIYSKLKDGTETKAGKLMDYLKEELDEKPFIVEVSGDNVVISLFNWRSDRTSGLKDDLQIIIAMNYRSNK